MKNIKIQLFAILLGLSAAAAPAAETAQSTGKVFEGENYTVIRETLPKMRLAQSTALDSYSVFLNRVGQ